MDPFSARTISIGSLQFQLMDKGKLRLSGTVDSAPAQTELRRRLEQLHSDIRDQRMSSFTVDVRSLNFVNSSAIRLFVDWISRAHAARYKLVFLIDRSITWHRLSFSVLKSLSPGFVELVEESALSSESLSGGSLTHRAPRSK
jgi:hypothetical protein